MYKNNKGFTGSKSNSHNGKEINLSISKNDIEDKFRLKSGMFNGKKLNKPKNIKVTVISFKINPPKKNFSTIEEDEDKNNKSSLYKNKDSLYKNFLNSKKSDNNLYIKRYTKKKLLNNLFNKYKNINNSFNKSNICENFNSNSLSDIARIKNKNIYMPILKDDDD